MIEMYAIVAVALIAAGAALGVVGLVTVGIRREEDASRKEGVVSLMAGSSPGRAASGARAAIGVYTRNSPAGPPAGQRPVNLLILNGERK
jgi:hypothetical protein